MPLNRTVGEAWHFLYNEKPLVDFNLLTQY